MRHLEELQKKPAKKKGNRNIFFFFLPFLSFRLCAAEGNDL